MSDNIIDISHEDIGVNALFYPLLRKLRVAEIINNQCPSDSEIDIGRVAELIILSRFSSERVPMYKLQSFCQKKGIGSLLRLDTTKINDDRAGRALDCLHPSLLNLKAPIIAGAIKAFNISVDEIHTDITNILFSGRYDKIESSELQITYGHTKKGEDPRKKQVNLSLSVTADGSIPTWYEALDGNTTDSVCYVPHLEALKSELGMTSPLIVGDSKLVSKNNMIAFCRAGAFFIGTASLNKDEKKRLVKLWEDGATFAPLPLKEEPKKPIPFWGMETERFLIDKEKKRHYSIRYLYIFSRQRREVIRHTRAKRFKKAKNGLHKIIRCLNKYDYKSEATILTRIKGKVTSKCPYYKIKLTKDENEFFSIEYSIDWEKLRTDEMFDGIYLLKCNCKKGEYPMKKVLRAFKGQCKVERRFSNTKQPPISVSPIWLQKPTRIESLLFLVFVALLLMALLEREARRKLQGIPLRTEKRDNLPLTAPVLIEAFKTIAIYKITQSIKGKTIIVKKCGNLSVAQREVLWRLSFPTINKFI